jgi:hypothetical protein
MADMLKNDNTSLKLHTQDLQGQLGGSSTYSHSKNRFSLTTLPDYMTRNSYRHVAMVSCGISSQKMSPAITE